MVIKILLLSAKVFFEFIYRLKEERSTSQNVHLTKCPSVKKSIMQNVYLAKCPSRKMSLSQNVFFDKDILRKRLFATRGKFSQLHTATEPNRVLVQLV